MITFKKMLMAFLMPTSIISSSIVSTVSKPDFQDPYHQSEEELLLKQKIRQNIDNNSVYYKTDTKYHYENKEYQDHDEIINKFLDKNPIITEKTSSNPNKIIKNYEYQQLDENKIYGIDKNDYIKVYKNALGKVVLPTCTTATPGQKGCAISNKSAEQRALDSYVNAGLIRPKYTYAFGGTENWYDNPTEAKGAYENSKFTIKKSLFYNYEGYYYNAFSKKDMEKLEKTNLHKGYYFDGVDSAHYDASQNIETFWDKEGNFEDRLKQSLENIFLANIDKLVNYETKIVIEVNPTDGEWIEGFSSSTEDIKFDKANNLLTIKNPLREGGINITDLLENLHDKSATENWKDEMLYDEGIFGQKCKNMKRYNYFGKIGKETFTFHLMTKGTGCDPGEYPTTQPDKIKTKLLKDKMEDDIKLNIEVTNPLLNKLMNLSSFYSPNWNVNDIATSAEQYDEEEAENIALRTYGKMYPSNWDQRFTNKMFEMFYENLKQALYTNQNSSPVIDDWTYGTKSNPIKFSVYQSKKDYETNILNSEIMHKTNDDNEQVAWTSPSGNFSTSWKNWVNNFTYLIHDNVNQIMPLKIMYYVDNNEKNDIVDFSDQEGAIIAPTIAQAENIAFMSRQSILRKKYFIYDIHGQLTVLANDEQTAIEKLRNKIDLDYTYININEAKKNDDQDLEWNDLISDGLYTVYKFKSSTGSWLYFKAYESAFERFQEQVGLVTAVVEESIKYYRYIFNYNNQRYSFDWTNDQQIDEIVKKIYQIIKQ